jgi:replicative DNA helicase
MAELDKKIINILINNKKELNDFVNNGGEGVFEKRYHRFVKTLLSYYKVYESNPSLNTLLEFVGKNESLRDNITEIWENTSNLEIDSREFTYLLGKIKNRYNKEIFGIIKNKFNSNDISLEEGNAFLLKAVGEIQNIGKKNVYKEVVLKDSVKDWLSEFQAKANKKEEVKGLKTGFKTIDYYLNGLKGGELLLYAADSGAGKSIFLTNFATNCFLGDNILPNSKEEAINKEWKKTSNVLFVSIEMGATELQNRVLSCMCDINSLNLDKAIITAEEAEKLKKAFLYWEYSGANMKIIDAPRGVKPSTIQDFYEKCCLEFKPDVIVIDYLSLLKDNTGDSESDWLKLKDISEELHELSRVLKVPIVSAVQLKVKKAGELGVGLFSIGRSSMIVQNANFVLQAEMRENEHERLDLKVHMIKNRRGPLFSFTAEKQFQFSKIVDNGMNIEKENKALSNDDLTKTMDMLLGKKE